MYKGIIMRMAANPAPEKHCKTFWGPTVEFPKDSGNYAPIESPPLTTIDFKCPECNAEVKQWCSNTPKEQWGLTPICKTREKLFTIIHKRYITGVQNHTIPFALSRESKQNLIQRMITELLKENSK